MFFIVVQNTVHMYSFKICHHGGDKQLFFISFLIKSCILGSVILGSTIGHSPIRLQNYLLQVFYGCSAGDCEIIVFTEPHVSFCTLVLLVLLLLDIPPFFYQGV